MMRVLVIYKRTTYQRYRGGQSKRISALLDKGDITVDRMMDEHHAHLATLDRARKTLRRAGTDATFRHRHDENTGEVFDLVITLGGDGTLLWASHMVGAETPMLAINSAPETSVGYFCAATPENLDEVVGQAVSGKLRATVLQRMQVEVDDESVSTRVLNDVLFCHECPAATSKYILEHGDTSEAQSSSGVWIGPAAGSTAAQRSAGGKVLPLRSQKLQYVVREPYTHGDQQTRLPKGLVPAGEALQLRSRMREGRMFLDGAQKTVRVDIGSVVRFSLSPEPLRLLGEIRPR